VWAQELGRHVMNSTSETNSPAISDSKESKDFLDLQSDLKDLFAKINSFVKATSELLSDVPREETSSVAKISHFTKFLFGVVAVLTIALNLGLNYVDATTGQMIIANLAISALHVLVGMCLISDLSKGRTHFQNERGQVQARIETVSEFLQNLLQERAQLVNAVCETKWQLENEQVKLQMSKLEVTSQQEKIEYLNSRISDKSSNLDEIKQQLSEVESQREKLLAQKQVVSDELNATMQQVQAKKAEIDRLSSEVESFRLKEQDGKASLQEANSLLKETSIRCEERQLELVEAEDKLGRFTANVAEKEEHLKRLSDSVFEHENRLVRIQSDLGQLNAQSAEVEQKVQSSLAREADLTSVCKKLEEENQTIRKSIEEAGLQLVLLENQVSGTTENSVQLEQGIQRLQVENLDLVNQTVALQSHLASQMELVTQCEAHLHSMAEAQKTKESRVKELDGESELLEERIAGFLKHLSELECLFVAKTMAEHGDKPVIAIEKEEDDSSSSETCEHVQPCPTCVQYQLEAEHRLSIASLMEEIEARQLAALDVVDESRQSALDAEKQIADAEKRVEMLSKKAEGLNEQVQERVNELYELKQDLIAMRSEKRVLESTLEERERAEGELVELKKLYRSTKVGNRAPTFQAP
jgi:myosin heavy subunit